MPMPRLMTETAPQRKRRIEQTTAEFGPDRSALIAGPSPASYSLRHLAYWRDVHLYGAHLFNCWQDVHADEQTVAESEAKGETVADDPYISCEYLALIGPDGLPCGVAMTYREPGYDPIDDDMFISEGEVCIAAPEGQRMFPLSIEQTDELIALVRQARPDLTLTYFPSVFGWHHTEFEFQVPWSDQMRELVESNYGLAHAYERDRQMRRSRRLHPRAGAQATGTTART
jgi:hypothetical protein